MYSTNQLAYFPQKGLKANIFSSVFACLLFCLLPLQLAGQNPIVPIGQWREHLSYQQALQVVKGNQVYCATNDAVFSVSADNSLSRFSKVTGLNDLHIAAIGWDESTKQLLIAYNNSNLDVLKGSIIKNIGDIKRSGIPGNKTINSIYCNNGLAFLSSGLGIIIADLNKYEIKDTWFIGSNAAQINVTGFTSDLNNYYAATTEGLKKASIQSANLSNSNNWPLVNAGLSIGAVKQVVNINNKIVVQKNDSLFIQKNGFFSFLFADANWPIIDLNSSNGQLQICERKTNGESRVLILSETGSILQNLSKPGIISFPKKAVADGNHIWVADNFGGLAKFQNGQWDQFIPNGPLGAASGDMTFVNNQLYVAAGSVNDAWNYQYNRNGVYQYINELWNYKGYFNAPILDSALDFICLAKDPNDGSIWAGSYSGGLVRFKENHIKVYKQNNSSLQPALGDPNSYRVAGLAFDNNQNLWISNYGAPQNLQVRKKDSSWKSIRIPFTHTENAVSQLLVDEQNQVWIISPKGNGIFCYNPGTNIDATNDDRWKNYLVGSGSGNLPSNNVRCLAKDNNGFIWVGTDKGIGIIQCSYDVFSGSGCDAILPIVQQDRFAGLLFQDETVQCIAVDGANRKWVGTKNGLWLISPDGDKIIYRFTEENSPLLNNDVKKIAINPITGEVFIAGLNGICSFRSTATEGTASMETELIFPNPVPAGYHGTIAIRGLTNNALVKITELNGQLVFQTRALGGQAICDGKQYSGTKVASGVYLVIVRDESGKEKLVTKIVFLSGR